MTNKMNIQISGGNAAIGALSQGDNSTVTGSASNSSTHLIQQKFDATARDITGLARELDRSAEDRDGALAELEKLKSQAMTPAPKAEDGNSVLKVVRDNFSWAYPAIKDFVKVAWPVLLGAIGS
jgi:hypothetical protein